MLRNMHLQPEQIHLNAYACCLRALCIKRDFVTEHRAANTAARQYKAEAVRPELLFTVLMTLA